ELPRGDAPVPGEHPQGAGPLGRRGGADRHRRRPGPRAPQAPRPQGSRLMFQFAHPAYLWGLFAIALPILVHLFNQRRPRPLSFGAIEFVLRSQRQRARRLRLRQIVLLALRCLLIAAVALALARPPLRPRGVQAAQGTRRRRWSRHRRRRQRARKVSAPTWSSSMRRAAAGFAAPRWWPRPCGPRGRWGRVDTGWWRPAPTPERDRCRGCRYR